MHPGAPRSSTCELELGVYLRRRCVNPAQDRCINCGRLACGPHLRTHAVPGRAQALWCLDCLRKLPAPREPERPWVDTSASYVPTPVVDAWSAPADPAPPPWTGGGGEFGGGGASGGWDDDAGFSPQDYAAFDQVSQQDRDEQRGAYDS